MNKSISFHLALNASPDDVNEVVDAIYRTYGMSNSGTVEPSALATAASQAAQAIVQADKPADAAAPATTAVAAAVAGNAELDKAGLPWDERIHAETKAKNKDGTWRARRNLDAAVKSKVEAELLGTVNSTPATGTAPPALPPAPARALPAAPGPTLPPPPAPSNSEYTDLVTLVVDNMEPKGRISEAWLKEVLDYYGVAEGSLQNLAHKPEVIGDVRAFITANAIG